MIIPWPEKSILAHVFCLTLIIAPGTGNTLFAGGFTDTHDNGDPLTNPGGSGWISQGTRSWSEASGEISAQNNTNGEGHLINDYSCANNGTFEAVLDLNNNWNSYYGGAFLRWTSTSSYFYVGILRGDGINNNGYLYWGKDSIPGTRQGTGTNFPPICTLKVECRADTFNIYINGALTATKIDAAHPSGKVGYAYTDHWDGTYLTWLESRWTDTDSTSATITQQPRSDTVAVGGSASMSVAANGNPDPTLQWQKHSGTIWSNISGATGSQYSITTATKADSGSYRVIAHNSIGADTSQSVNLLVYSPPAITEHPRKPARCRWAGSRLQCDRHR